MGAKLLTDLKIQSGRTERERMQTACTNDQHAGLIFPGDMQAWNVPGIRELTVGIERKRGGIA